MTNLKKDKIKYKIYLDKELSGNLTPLGLQIFFYSNMAAIAANKKYNAIRDKTIEDLTKHKDNIVKYKENILDYYSKLNKNKPSNNS
jgi:hypothetical protein